MSEIGRDRSNLRRLNDGADFRRLYPYNWSADTIKVGTKTMRGQAPLAEYCLKRNLNHPNHFRFEVTSDDIRPGDESGTLPFERNRSEMAALDDPQPFDTDIWFSYAFKPLFTSFYALWTIIGQWHATEDDSELATNPNWKLEVGPDRRIRILTSGSQQDPMTTHAPTVVRYEGSEIVSGRWYHVVGRCKFSKTAGAGEVQNWVNGTEVLNASSIDMGFVDVDGPYWKLGIYRRADDALPFVLETANQEWGTASLLDRVTNPLPLP